jgi:hypothetical protein
VTEQVASPDYENQARARLARALELLKRAGCPGLVSRSGEISPPRNWLQKKLSLWPAARPVALEPAWPIGDFGWRCREVWKSLPTGFTPSGHAVPMTHAIRSDQLYVQNTDVVIGAGTYSQQDCKWDQQTGHWGAGYERSHAFATLQASDIAAALESEIARHGLSQAPPVV